MNLLTKIQSWGDHHHPKWLDYFRILLGLILFWKGIAFALNLHAFTIMMENAMLGTSVSISLVAHLIIAFHLIGGLLIALGTHTRLFCLLNLPILFAAVFFINLSPNIFRPYSEVWLSGLVFIGLIIFLIEGDGVLSIEHQKSNVAMD
jgi:putative oxidoreductase